MIFGFLVYVGCAVLFFGLAIHAVMAKTPVGIWSNIKMQANIKDIRGYNRAAAKLFAAYGAALVLCGLPMLFDAGEAVILLVCVLGIAAATVAMIFAAVQIDMKYKRR